MKNPARQVTVTKAELAQALAAWEAEAASNNWRWRTDDQRHEDTAEYLMDLIEKR